MKFYCLIKPYFLKLLLSFTLTFIMSSCKNISLDQIDNDFNQFIKWAISDSSLGENKEYVPVSSVTLNSFISIDENYMKYDFILESKDNIIGAFIFENDKFETRLKDKNTHILFDNFCSINVIKKMIIFLFKIKFESLKIKKSIRDHL